MGQGFSIKAKGKSAAEILLYEDIGAGLFGGVTAKQFAADLKALGPVENIDVRINSYGGDVFDGLAIYRQIVDHKARVVTHVDGVAASIASVIAMAGDEIRISESGFLMVHAAWAVALGNADDLRTMANLLDTTTATLRDVYVARTGQSAERVSSWMAAETWLTAAEAVEHGFANSIVDNLRIAARFDPALHKFRNAPAELQGTPNLDAARERLAAMKAKMGRRAA